MNINIFNKIRAYYTMLSNIPKVPTKKNKIRLLFKPIDATRYTEFPYLIKFLRKNKIYHKSINNTLDISSPFMMSYYLSRFSKVIKTDINPNEKHFIREQENLKFQLENSLNLSFEDNQFDLVYSISVIEHIYEKYIDSIKEMIRVTKKNGLLYITIPVAKEYQEEWLDSNIYSNQYKAEEKTFFQYRFDEAHINTILESIKDSVNILSSDIYWERRNGDYDKLILKLRKQSKSVKFKLVKNMILNYFYGFFSFTGKSESFEKAKSFGNIHLILRKK